MKKLICFFFLFLWMIPIFTEAIVEPSNTLYVTDQANVLTTETKDYIIQYSDFLSKSYQIHYYVVTVNSLEGYDLDTYAEMVFSSFQVGRNGLLIFFAKNDRRIKVVVGQELGLLLDNDTIQEGIDSYFMPYFKNDDWNHGIRNGYSAFYKMICNYYHIDSSPMEVFDGKDFLTKYNLLILAFLLFLGSLISYVFCNNMEKDHCSSNRGFMHFFTFGACLFTNILVLLAAYFIKPWSILLVLASEAFTFFSFFSTGSKTSIQDALYFAKQKDEKKRRRVMKRKIQRRR